jgi:hypothetical protein
MKKYICKYCKVEVRSKTNLRAVLGQEHGKHCPRRFK